VGKQKTVSRKGAKKARKEQVAFNTFAAFLCVFAPLREILFRLDRLIFVKF
jgi:hypothetical protein